MDKKKVVSDFLAIVERALDCNHAVPCEAFLLALGVPEWISECIVVEPEGEDSWALLWLSDPSDFLLGGNGVSVNEGDLIKELEHLKSIEY